MNDDRRAALEAIAYGDDSEVRPGDRLRALELLEGVPGEQRPIAEYVQEVTGEALDNELDPLLAGTVEAALTNPDDTRYPALVAAFRRAVERHAAAQVDVGRIEAEVERRAQEKAEAMYRSRSFSVVAEPPQEAGDASVPASAIELPPQPPQGAEGGAERPDDRAVLAGFPSGRPRRRSGRFQPPSADERMGR
jgi:hypothetical protein